VAARFCSCGRELEELRCADCGPARTWLVRAGDDGEVVGAGDAEAIYATRALLHTGLGLTPRTLELAAAPGFRHSRHVSQDG
jgi:hypothetical protein